MPVEFVQNNFEEQPLQCNRCRWQGTGAEAIVIDFYDTVKNKEVHCPQCDEKLGIVRSDNDPPPGESATDPSIQFG